MCAAAWFTSHASKASSATDLKTRSSNQLQLGGLAMTGYGWLETQVHLVTGPLTKALIFWIPWSVLTKRFQNVVGQSYSSAKWTTELPTVFWINMRD